MVHFLMLLQMEVIQDFVDGVSFDPENVPVFAFNFAIAPLAEGVKDAVLERRFELDL